MFNIFKTKKKSKMTPNKKKKMYFRLTFTTYDREKTSIMHLLTRFIGEYPEIIYYSDPPIPLERLPLFFDSSDLILNNNGYKFKMGIQEFVTSEYQLLDSLITSSDCIGKNFFLIIVIAFPINDLNWFNKTRGLFKKSIFKEKNMILVGTHLEYRLDPKYKKKLVYL
jgi:hypothetical protein